MSTSRLTAAWIGALALAVLAAACSESSGPGPSPDLELDTIATGMDHPLYVTSPPGDRTRLFIVERSGAIRIIKNGVLQATPFLDITAEVSTGAEQGILGIAFPPDYATSKYFVVYYVNPSVQTVLSR